MMTFPLSLSGKARKWWMNEGDGKNNTWEELVNKFFSKIYPLSCASNYDKMCVDDEEEVGNNEGIIDEDVSSDDDRDHTSSSMITKPELNIGDEFLKILHDNSFNGMDGSDITKHIGKVLEITEWIKIPNVDKDERLVAPEVGAVSVISPTGVLDLSQTISSSLLSRDPRAISLLPLMMLWFRGGGTGSHLGTSLRAPSSYYNSTPSSEFPFAPIVATIRDSLAWRRASHRSSINIFTPQNLTSDSSSSGSSSYSSSVHSSEFDASSQTHLGPSTRVASPRLVYLLVLTPRYSEAFRHWRSTPLSTLYPPMTSESSLDLSFERSLDSYSLLLDHLAKCSRIHTSPEIAEEKHMKDWIADAETVADLGISDGVGAHTKDGIGMGVEIAASSLLSGGREDFEQMLVRSLRIPDMTITHSGMTLEAIEELVSRRVEEVLATYEATRTANALRAKSQSQNGSDQQDMEMVKKKIQNRKCINLVEFTQMDNWSKAAMARLESSYEVDDGSELSKERHT
ncbi:hypothetical protein Tco_0649609 [Tanacetum coccineum]